ERVPLDRRRSRPRAGAERSRRRDGFRRSIDRHEKDRPRVAVRRPVRGQLRRARLPGPGRRGRGRRRGRQPGAGRRAGHPLLRRPQHAARAGRAGPAPPPRAGRPSRRRRGEQRKDDDEGAAARRALAAPARARDRRQPEQPGRRAADAPGDAGRRGSRHRRNGDQRAGGDYPPLPHRGARRGHHHGHRRGAPRGAGLHRRRAAGGAGHLRRAAPGRHRHRRRRSTGAAAGNAGPGRQCARAGLRLRRGSEPGAGRRDGKREGAAGREHGVELPRRAHPHSHPRDAQRPQRAARPGRRRGVGPAHRRRRRGAGGDEGDQDAERVAARRHPERDRRLLQRQPAQHARRAGPAGVRSRAGRKGGRDGHHARVGRPRRPPAPRAGAPCGRPRRPRHRPRGGDGRFRPRVPGEPLRVGRAAGGGRRSPGGVRGPAPGIDRWRDHSAQGLAGGGAGTLDSADGARFRAAYRRDGGL
ncbi:MAG: UDP-N-acetylmuramoyl-tripeptide--D-alanyl-D-alanine ligase, partial [uncultured Gemmatimonadetes bacterium]